MNSSNLAWDGIKCMESHDYRLVRKLCRGVRSLEVKAEPGADRDFSQLSCKHEIDAEAISVDDASNESAHDNAAKSKALNW